MWSFWQATRSKGRRPPTAKRSHSRTVRLANAGFQSPPASTTSNGAPAVASCMPAVRSREVRLRGLPWM